MGNCWRKLFGQNDDDERYQEIKLAGGNVHLITSWESWDTKLYEASRDGKIVVANFSATWCSPCRTIAPAYCKLADKYPSVTFLTVDVDVLAELSAKWDIRATPTFFFLKDGRHLDKVVGANKEELHKKTVAIADHVSRSQN